MKVFLFFSIISFSTLAQVSRIPKVQFELGVGGNNEGQKMERWLEKNNDTAFFITSTGINPIRFKADFITRKRFQFGFEFNYSRMTLYYFENSYLDEYNLLKTPTIMEDHQKFKWMIRGTYLFPISNDKIHFYSSLSFGYCALISFNIIYDTPVPKSDVEVINKGPFMYNSPFCVNAYFGTRYYFSKNIGIHLEAGYGSSLMNAGISWRIGKMN